LVYSPPIVYETEGIDKNGNRYYDKEIILTGSSGSLGKQILMPRMSSVDDETLYNFPSNYDTKDRSRTASAISTDDYLEQPSNKNDKDNEEDEYDVDMSGRRNSIQDQIDNFISTLLSASSGEEKSYKDNNGINQGREENDVLKNVQSIVVNTKDENLLKEDDPAYDYLIPLAQQHNKVDFKQIIDPSNSNSNRHIKMLQQNDDISLDNLISKTAKKSEMNINQYEQNKAGLYNSSLSNILLVC
jgi:hypothetical protein